MSFSYKATELDNVYIQDEIRVATTELMDEKRYKRIGNNWTSNEDPRLARSAVLILARSKAIRVAAKEATRLAGLQIAATMPILSI
jgi:hypothetical protein